MNRRNKCPLPVTDPKTRRKSPAEEIARRDLAFARLARAAAARPQDRRPAKTGAAADRRAIKEYA